MCSHTHTQFSFHKKYTCITSFSHTYTLFSASINKHTHIQKLTHSLAHAHTHTQADLFSQVLADDLLDLVHGALGGSAVQHLERAGVLLGQQVVQGAQVLPYLDEGASVGAAQVAQPLRRAPVDLRDQKGRTRSNTQPALALSFLATLRSSHLLIMAQKYNCIQVKLHAVRLIP